MTREQLLAAGLSKGQVQRRVRKGALIVEFPGVYRAGHAAQSTEATYMAAVKACGQGAALAGMAAAYLMGVAKGRPPAPEVTAPTERRVDGVITHRSRRIEKWIFNGIPTTTVARTLVDLAGELDDELGTVVHEAQARYRTTPRQVEQVLKHRPNAPGAARLRRIIRGDTHISLRRSFTMT